MNVWNRCYTNDDDDDYYYYYYYYYEGDCKTCSLGLKLKESGRPPKKGSLGRKKTSEAVCSKTDQGLQSRALLQHIEELSKRLSVNRLKISRIISHLWGRLKKTSFVQFVERFLDPLSRQCEHHFCAGRLTQAVELANTSLSCPVCKEKILHCDLEQPTRMIVRMLGKSRGGMQMMQK